MLNLLRVRPNLRLLQVACLLAGGVSSVYAADQSRIRVERKPIAGGAELITWFEKLPENTPGAAGNSEMPILAALNDTLSAGDSGDDRLRQVWAFTFASPSLVQRAEAAVPFLYYRLALSDAIGSKRPKPIFDMGAPSRGTSGRVAMAVGQAEFIDPAGAIARLTSRSYGGNLGQYKTAHIWEALDIISSGPEENQEGVTPDQFQLLQSRLELSGRMLGGLVGDAALPRFYAKLQIERTETRGHNWELLRQSAENNGLYFQPLAIDGLTNSFAMVWVARRDLEDPERRFDAQFLKIENPFRDDRLLRSNGYSQSWDLEGKPTEMIPLALYSLDYPGVPLLLVDFRRASAPRRTEMTLRVADDVTTGVLGFTGFGHLGFLALKSSWLFIDKRHGGATDRAARSRAVIQLRHALGADDSLDPRLRAQLAKRVEALALDSVERTWEQEVQASWAQYNALLKYADDPQGLPKFLREDREQEARALAHGPGARTMMRVASVATFGAYRHHDALPPEELQRIADRRREALAKRTPTLPNRSDPPRTLAAGAGE